MIFGVAGQIHSQLAENTCVDFGQNNGGVRLASSQIGKLLDGFFRLSLLLPPTFAVVAMIDVLESDKDGSLSEQMTAHPDFAAWQDRFGNELGKRR